MPFFGAGETLEVFLYLIQHILKSGRMIKAILESRKADSRYNFLHLLLAIATIDFYL